MFIFYPTRGFIENNECIVGDHLVSLPVVSCMARGILLRWMVRLFIAIWSVCWRYEDLNRATDARREITARGRPTHGGGKTRMVTGCASLDQDWCSATDRNILLVDLESRTLLRVNDTFILTI